MPYKLQAAAVLADYGHVSRALQYCSTLDAGLRAAAAAAAASSASRDQQAGIPPSLILMANQLEGLRERLATHAAAHNIKVGLLVKKIEVSGLCWVLSAQGGSGCRWMWPRTTSRWAVGVSDYLECSLAAEGVATHACTVHVSLLALFMCWRLHRVCVHACT
jgi:hypothetical protein